LTTAGEDIRDQAEGQLAKRLDSAISALPEGDIARLEEGLRVLEEIIGTLESQRTNRRGPKTASGS
jgi:hypothetical protein